MSTAKFDFSPRIIKLLGEELIHDKKIAISELVKNAYDADAEVIKITINHDEILIEDDGCGMTQDIIENYWLCPGNSTKRDTEERTPKFNRLPLGEKGVGRLGVHRLGDKIEVISKCKGYAEINFSIDWSEFEKAKTIQDITPIQITTNEISKVFKDHTGTQLKISKLREKFNDKDIASLKQDLMKLLPPFQGKNDSFNIELYNKNGLFIDGEGLDIGDMLKQAFFEFKIVFEGDEIIDFNYKFTPSPHPKVQPKEITYTDAVKEVIEQLRNKQSKTLEENLFSGQEKSHVNFGKVIFRGYVFETKLASSFNASYDKSTTSYLKSNSGIRVYRDGMRVYNYGEEGKDNDILNLDRKRAKKLGDNIGYNQILATIELDLEKSKNLLREKTNREGFIHNEAFRHLQQYLDLCMDLFIHYRKLDKAEISLLFGKQYDRGDIDNRVNNIKSQIENLNISDAEKTKITSDLNNFSNEFKQIKDIFLTASNTGLNMTFIIHEVDKIIDHLEEEINNQNFTKIKSIFNHLKNTISAYKATIRLDKKSSSIKLTSIVKQAMFNADYRFRCHQIKLPQELDENILIVGKKGLLIGVINNIFDNAIYWLETYRIKNKKIFIKSYSDQLHHHLVIADNGKGFNISFEAALGPFISGRIDESSMGIGLHLADQVMQAHGGTINHGNQNIDNIPQEFANGAIIKLSFPKEMK